MIYGEVIMCYSGEERQCLAFVKLGKKKDDDDNSLNHAHRLVIHCNVVLSFNSTFLDMRILLFSFLQRRFPRFRDDFFL